MVIIKRIARAALSPLAPAMLNRYFSKGKSMFKKGITTISFDCDLGRDIDALPKLLEILNSYKMRCSFACVGKWIEKNPKIHRRILDEGHEIINHTYSHPNSTFNKKFFNKLPELEQKSEITRFEDVCANLLDYTPRGFRTPHLGNLHGQFIYPMLEELGYLHSSSTILTKTNSYGMPYFPSRKNYCLEGKPSYKVLELPIMVCPQHYFPLFDSWHCFRSRPPAHQKQGEFLELFKKAVNMIMVHKAVGTFYFDPSDITNNQDFAAILGFLVKSKVQIERCEDVASRLSK